MAYNNSYNNSYGTNNVQNIVWARARLPEKSHNLTAPPSTGLIEGLKESPYDFAQNKRIKYRTANVKFFSIHQLQIFHDFRPI